jgi:hypothetical protein
MQRGKTVYDEKSLTATKSPMRVRMVEGAKAPTVKERTREPHYRKIKYGFVLLGTRL